ncbi:magnesium transporter [Synergistaceae bacterium OttesenSCG-928-D05]|nr:magnesium transporter [Synergistaceae bacterium OttesenSCG-928-D05]
MSQLTQEKFEELLRDHKYVELHHTFSEMNVVDIAQFIEELPIEQAVVAFRTLPKETESEVFAEFESETQQRIIASISDREIADLIEDTWIDDAVDILEELPAPLVKRVLDNASRESRNLINQYLRYPENSAGSIMTAEFMDLRADMTVAEAIRHIRSTGHNRETIYTCYVLGREERLDGVVSVRNLLIANDDEKVEDLMSSDVIYVTTLSDREDAANTMAKYGLAALPVVDTEEKLVGIVTVDDALDVIMEETTEDFERMAAMRPSEKPYLKTSITELARNRFPWLLFLMVSGMLTGWVLGRYEAIYTALPILVTFIPMLTGTGGNAGSQSSTMVVRGLALGELETDDILKVIWKEGRVSILVGLALGAVNFVRLWITYPDSALVPFVVAIAQFGAIVLANFVGGVLPIIAKTLRIDPAIMSAPLVTTIVDVAVLMLYFFVAGLMLI